MLYDLKYAQGTLIKLKVSVMIYFKNQTNKKDCINDSQFIKYNSYRLSYNISTFRNIICITERINTFNTCVPNCAVEFIQQDFRYRVVFDYPIAKCLKYLTFPLKYLYSYARGSNVFRGSLTFEKESRIWPSKDTCCGLKALPSQH